jgi:translation initiation factor IF-2
MKTLTELSGTLIRTASAAIADARRSLPKEEKPVAAPAEAPPAIAASAAAPPAEAPGEVPSADAPPAEAPPAPESASGDQPAAPAAESVAAPAPAATPPKPRGQKPAQEPESEAVKAIFDAAVATATGLSGDRLALLRAAVEAAGRRAEDVRLVRVFGPEEPVPGATAIGGHQYLVDYFPASMKQVVGSSRDDRGGRGGRGGGRGGPGGGGGRGAKGGSATGGFSMDSLREDRKNERGGGRGRPAGGRRPGGDPKK